MKRYRLKIPELKRCEARIINNYAKMQEKELNPEQIYHIKELDKEDWLEEIDEPMSAEESYQNMCITEKDRLHLQGYKDYYYLGFKAGAAENEKKHRLQETFEEWFSGYPKCYDKYKDNLRHAWQAHAKATNTEA